jgi:hypothetical protein
METPVKNKDRQRHVKLFTQPYCPKCPSAEVLVDIVYSYSAINLIDTIFYHDIRTPDGLAEAAFHNVMSTPTIIILDGHDRILARWNGEVPTREEFETYLKR